MHVFLQTDWQAACKQTRWSMWLVLPCRSDVWGAAGIWRIRSAVITSSLKTCQHAFLCRWLLRILQHLQILHQTPSDDLENKTKQKQQDEQDELQSVCLFHQMRISVMWDRFLLKLWKHFTHKMLKNICISKHVCPAWTFSSTNATKCVRECICSLRAINNINMSEIWFCRSF